MSGVDKMFLTLWLILFGSVPSLCKVPADPGEQRPKSLRSAAFWLLNGIDPLLSSKYDCLGPVLCVYLQFLKTVLVLKNDNKENTGN